VKRKSLRLTRLLLRRGPKQPRFRTGTAMIVAIICLMLVSTICFALVRHAVLAQQQAQRREWQLQSAWLADSALLQAAAQLQRDATREDFRWQGEDLSGLPLPGRVEVVVQPGGEDPQERLLVATADYPDDPTDRVRTIRRRVMSLSSTPASTD
jgi:hypothetical protein